MSFYKTVLLATFTPLNYLDSVVAKIFRTFKIENDKIFIFSDENSPDKKIITYNVIVPDNTNLNIKQIKNTIRINRKKDSNTLYTINSLNKIIEKEIGRIDENYKIDWNRYRNQVLISNKDSEDVIIIDTSVYNIITKENFYKKNTAIVHKNPQYI